MEDFEWQRVEELNAWTGETKVRYLRKFSDRADLNRTYAQIYELDGRLYWSVNIYVAYRPDLTRLVSGTLAATPRALAVAKGCASRKANRAIRATTRRR